MEQATGKVVIQFRAPAESMAKLKVIAAREERSMNSQISVFLRQGIERYEKEYGPIKIEEETD